MPSSLYPLTVDLLKDLKHLDRLLTFVKNAASGPAKGGAADRKLAEAILLLAQATSKAEALRRALPK
jgi:hypothetical protein